MKRGPKPKPKLDFKPRPKCKRFDCENLAAKGKVYCSSECAPLTYIPNTSSIADWPDNIEES